MQKGSLLGGVVAPERAVEAQDRDLTNAIFPHRRDLSHLLHHLHSPPLHLLPTRLPAYGLGYPQIGSSHLLTMRVFEIRPCAWSSGKRCLCEDQVQSCLGRLDQDRAMLKRHGPCPHTLRRQTFLGQPDQRILRATKGYGTLRHRSRESGVVRCSDQKLIHHYRLAHLRL